MTALPTTRWHDQALDNPPRRWLLVTLPDVTLLYRGAEFCARLARETAREMRPQQYRPEIWAVYLPGRRLGEAETHADAVELAIGALEGAG